MIRVSDSSEHPCDLKDDTNIYPIDFEPQEGSKGGNPDELTISK